MLFYLFISYINRFCLKKFKSFEKVFWEGCKYIAKGNKKISCDQSDYANDSDVEKTNNE